MEDKALQSTKEQRAYATLLDIGMKIGLTLVVVTFIIYLSGALTPLIPIDELPSYWELTLESHDGEIGFLEATGTETGWGWVNNLGKGDILNFAGIAFLAAITIICFLRIAPMLLMRKDIVYGIFALVQAAVLIVAASGITGGGGH